MSLNPIQKLLELFLYPSAIDEADYQQNKKQNHNCNSGYPEFPIKIFEALFGATRFLRGLLFIFRFTFLLKLVFHNNII
jgi:hypothetical protein